MTGFIGRTIVGMEQPDDDYCWLLRLDDGTAVEFAVRGYDNEDISVVHVTDEVLEQRAQERAAFERAEIEGRRQRVALMEARRKDIAEMREKFSSEEFETWRRGKYPTVTEMLRDTWTSEALQLWRQP